MTKKIRIWHPGSEPAFVETRGPYWLTRSKPALAESPAAAGVAILGVSSPRPLIGVAFVPDALDAVVARNGVLLRPGIHGLLHRDRLESNGQSLWVASCAAVEPTAYDPSVHGDGIFCFLTKARLVAGQAIVLCPGTPGNSCNVIYRQEAWDLATDSSTRLRCANCGFSPDETAWQPPKLTPKNRINEILESIIASC